MNERNRSYNGLTPMQETVLLELARRPSVWVQLELKYWRTAASLCRRGMVHCYRSAGSDTFRARLKNGVQ